MFHKVIFSSGSKRVPGNNCKYRRYVSESRFETYLGVNKRNLCKDLYVSESVSIIRKSLDINDGFNRRSLPNSKV